MTRRLSSQSPTFRADFLRLVQANMLRHADQIADTSRLWKYFEGEAADLAAMIADALARAAAIRAEYGATAWHAVQLAKWNLHALAHGNAQAQLEAIAA